MRIFWLASYPRSGNTWLRFLLYTYLYGPITTTAEINARIPDLHRRPKLNPADPGRVLMKTHLALTPAHPLLAQTVGFIHIRRHPKDVLLSGLNYHALNGSNLSPAAYVKAFVAQQGDPAWRMAGFSTWEGHIASWLDNPKFPHVWTTYERLKADTAGELRRVLEFIEEPVDDARLADAVERCSFENLRALEEQEKSAGKASLFPGAQASREKGHRFINRGETGQSLAQISPDLDPLFDTAFAPILARRGY